MPTLNEVLEAKRAGQPALPGMEEMEEQEPVVEEPQEQVSVEKSTVSPSRGLRRVNVPNVSLV